MAKKNKHNEIVIDPERFNPSHEYGLSEEQVNLRKEQGLVNKIIKKTGKSYLSIIISNFCTLFNIIYAVVFLLLFTAQKANDSVAITNYTFLIIVFINILIGTIQEIKSKITISKLQLISTPTVTVVRQGEKKEVNVSDVVIDDIVYLTPGKEITTDSILIHGEVDVNESQLTGESVPINKQVGDTLFSGSFVVSGNCYCKVERVGADNAIEKLSAQAKQYKKPNSQILNTVKGLIKVITVFLVITGIVMILQNYNFLTFADSENKFEKFLYNDFYLGFLHKIFPNASNDWLTTINSTCTALLGMIPSGLIMMTSAALVLGVIRLARHQTLVQDLYCVEMLARVDVLCLDKTGTITDGTMSVVNYIDLQKNKYDIKTIISHMNAALQESNSTAKALEKYFGVDASVSCTNVIPFSSDRKFSGVTFGEDTYLIGAPEFVLKNGFDKYADLVTEEANKGYRVLCLAVTKQDSIGTKISRQPKPIAFILIEDQIRPDAEATIRYFRESGVEVKVISGDNPVTVSEVAKRVGIANAENYISLDGLSDDEVYEAAINYTVFGRVKPNQKQIIVKSLKDHKKTVAMTGDGVNDILALKEADCSIAMASGSDAVRSVAQLVLLDSSFSSMPKVVDEGRRAINNVQQMAMLFLVKTFFVLTLVLLTVIGFFKKTSGDGSFPFANPTQLLMIELFVIGIPSAFLTIQPNKNRVSGNFLWNVLQKSLPGVVAIVVAVIVTYLLHEKCGFEIEITKTIVVMTTTLIGLMILYLACRPFTWKKIVLFVGMCVCCIFISTQSMYPSIVIGNFALGDIIHDQFQLFNLIFKVTTESGEVVYNLTALLLTICLVACSFIIMSICSYIIALINKINLVRTLNKSKKEVQIISDIEDYIDELDNE